MKSFKDVAIEIGELLEEKNVAYGNSFSQSNRIIEVLYPNGIPVSNYKDALLMIRVIDKLFRIANKKDAFGENPWKDIAGYAILGYCSGDSDEDRD